MNRKRLEFVVGCVAAVAVVAAVWAFQVAGSHNPRPTDDANSMTDPNAQGMVYLVVYQTADGKIVALHIFEPGDVSDPLLHSGEATLNVTADPNKAQFFSDITSGLDVWKVNLSTLTLQHL